MEKEFIFYAEALALKELGFDEPCLAMFDEYKIFEYNSILHNANILIDCVSAPLYQQAFRWFREKYALCGIIDIGRHDYSFWILDEKSQKRIPIETFDGTYEEAELECLKKLIEIVKN
jgi:hypothetical protein